MLRLCLTLTVFVSLSPLIHGQSIVGLLQDTPVRIKIAQSFSARDVQVGQQIEFEVADTVWCSDIVAIPRGAVVVGAIAPMHKPVFRRTDEIWIRLLYIRAASGERIPVHILRQGEADWKIDLVKKVVPRNLETTAFVSRDMQLLVVAPTTLDHPGAASPISLRPIVSR